MGHARVPFADFLVSRDQVVMAAKKKVLQHSEKVKVHKTRYFTEQKRAMHQHLLERHEAIVKLPQPVALVGAPLLDAAPAEFALLEPDVLQLVSRADVFLVKNVVQTESRSFDIILNVPPENALHAFQLSRKKSQPQLRVQVLGNHLRLVAHLENVGAAVHDHWYAVIALTGEFPDECAVLRGDVDDFERRSRIL